MKNFLLLLAGLVILISCKETTEVIPFTSKGVLKGNVIIRSENGYSVVSREGIQIVLEGADPELSTTTDAFGDYQINNIPAGTYNLKANKDGCGEVQYQGIQIVGGENPTFRNLSIAEKTKTKIESISLEVDGFNDFLLKGTVFHEIDLTMQYPIIQYYIHTDNNPSNTNFLSSYSASIYSESGDTFEHYLYIDDRIFTSGEEVYIVVYGCNPYDWGYYDIATNEYVYSSLGEASNIIQVTIP